MLNYFLDFVKSTIIVVSISLLGALAAYLFGVNYIAAFLFLFVIQFIMFSFVGTILTNYFKEKTKQKQLDVLEPLSSILECAYCNHQNLITFFPNQNERVEFVCDKCGNKNLVNLTFTVARITQEIKVPDISGIRLTTSDEKQEQ
jgi:predicted permease